MKPNLSQQIQRFADGELSREAQDELFLELDVRDDDSWRTLALAMIEASELRRNLAAQQPKRRPRIVPFVAPTTIAAALALVLGIGIGQSNRTAEESQPPPAAADTIPTATPVALGHDITVRSTLVRATAKDGSVRLLPFHKLEIRPSL